MRKAFDVPSAAGTPERLPPRYPEAGTLISSLCSFCMAIHQSQGLGRVRTRFVTGRPVNLGYPAFIGPT